MSKLPLIVGDKVQEIARPGRQGVLVDVTPGSRWPFKVQYDDVREGTLQVHDATEIEVATRGLITIIPNGVEPEQWAFAHGLV